MSNERNERDYYQTPHSAIKGLLESDMGQEIWRDNTPMTVVDLGCGDGRLGEAVAGFSPRRVDETHMVDIDLGPLRERLNRGELVGAGKIFQNERSLTEFSFMNTTPDRNVLVIMNPPYSLKELFVETALDLAGNTGRVVALMPISYLGSLRRARMRPPSALRVLAPRPSFGLNKHGKRGTAQAEYAWFTWAPSRPGGGDPLFAMPPIGTIVTTGRV